MIKAEKNTQAKVEIDWHAQWANSGAIERDGYFEIDLSKILGRNTPPLKMLPGGGFGDLSHPTTVLTLKLMARLVQERCLIDIGCGSGILSLAAALLGASEAIGIDIDSAALEHAVANATFNKFDMPLSFIKPESLPQPRARTPLLIAMNMIYSEQEVAWATLPQLHVKGIDCITSGILQEHKDHYLAICRKWGWRLISTMKMKGWLAFHFTT
jgi:ribosomal protein L11 methyltransferase